MHEAAKALLQSLQEAIAVFEAQRQQAEAARRKANSAHEFLSQYVASRQAGSDPEALNRLRQEWLSTAKRGRSFDELLKENRAISHLSLRREQAFCDAYEALMRLYAYPEVRESAAQVADTIRAVRLLQVDRDDNELPEFMRSSRSSGESGDLEADESQKEQPAESVHRFLSGMEPWREKVDHTYHEKMERTRLLLNQTLIKAQALAHSAEDAPGERTTSREGSL